MVERERDGVTIDVCEDCRGIWLDRGELEKLLSKVEPVGAYASREPAYAGRDRYEERDRRYDDRDRRYDDRDRARDRKRKERGSIFDLFEMFGD